MRQVPPARPQAAVQAVRALTPSPGRSRIRELRIRNEVNSTHRGALRNVACRLSLIYWSAGGCSRQNAAMREVMRNGGCAGEVAHEFLSSRQRPTYTRYEFFAVWHAAVAKLSFLITGPPPAVAFQLGCATTSGAGRSLRAGQGRRRGTSTSRCRCRSWRQIAVGRFDMAVLL